MIVLDTNVIIAFLDRKDSLHKIAVESIKQHKDERFCTINVIIAEAYSVLAKRCRERRFDCKKALRVLKDFENELEVFWIEISKDMHETIVDIMINNEGRINYNDVLLANFVREKRFKLLTFDKKLEDFLKILVKDII
ncbi:MAG TPA: type II toxin-antitoxin system VapC family toxin [Candidatus Desulfofervidus auxilii]|uniref:Ribonuclease VapC n=1 Tax=Desulfofervidus auxilii TaxID=1621989 RepID=A0A7C0U2Q6_DESA2|nr:type II toxin-antitoxin system VapC family toxin [Candidatus Desulfofervidus auxilii]